MLLLTLLVLLAAATLRLCGLDWDGGIGAHPDERFVAGVAESLRWPDRLDPFAAAPGLAYGHLPLYLLAAIGGLGGASDLLIPGRVLAMLLDLGTVALTVAVGQRIYGARVGLLAAAFVALAVLHIQQAHFYTVDVLATFFVLSALLGAVRLARTGECRYAWMAGGCAGLAMGTKFSVVLVALPLAAALLVSSNDGRRRWRHGLAMGMAAMVAFAPTNPFALLRFPTFWRNVVAQAAIVRGASDVPYTRQFHGTWPYVYPVIQQVRWGLGWPLGLLALAGLAYGVWRAVRKPPRPGEWVLLAWTLPYSAFVGALYAKFPRYLLVLTPVLALWAARLLDDLRRRRPLAALAVTLVVLMWSIAWSVAFVSIYTQPHPWVVVSEWFVRHAPGGAVIAVEEWDQPLPLAASGEYTLLELPVFDEDTSEKWRVMEAILARADYIVIASRRGYATLPRWPERYPRTAGYYAQLFAGELGFEPLVCFGRAPRIGPVAVADDPTLGLGFSLPEICGTQAPVVLRPGRLDESLVVYDHPQVLVFGRRAD